MFWGKFKNENLVSIKKKWPFLPISKATGAFNREYTVNCKTPNRCQNVTE